MTQQLAAEDYQAEMRKLQQLAAVGDDPWPEETEEITLYGYRVTVPVIQEEA